MVYLKKNAVSFGPLNFENGYFEKVRKFFAGSAEYQLQNIYMVLIGLDRYWLVVIGFDWMITFGAQSVLIQY